MVERPNIEWLCSTVSIKLVNKHIQDILYSNFDSQCYNVFVNKNGWQLLCKITLCNVCVFDP